MFPDFFRPSSPLKAARTLPRLSLSHAVALALVAAFSIVSYLVLSFATESNTDTGLIITAGQQRVTGQRIAMLAAQLASSNESAEIVQLQSQLGRALNQFEHLHQLVSSGAGDVHPLSETTRRIYGEPPYQLNVYIDEYIALARSLLMTSFMDIADAEATIDALIAASIPVDVGISRIVTQLRDERRERVQALLNLELGMTIATLIGLGTVGLGILLPLQARMRSAIQTLDQEIDTRAKAETALAESAANYQSLVASLTEGVLLYDRQGHLVMYNSSAERLLRLRLNEYLGKATFDAGLRVIHPNGAEQQPDERPVMKTLRTGEPANDVVFGFVRDDGEPTWLKVNVQPVFQGDAVKGAAVSLTDITESKRVTEELVQSRALMQTILDNSPDAVFVVDRQSHILLVNPAETRIMGLADPADAVGKTVFDIYPPERAQMYYNSEQAVMASGEIVPDKLEYLKDDQGERWFSVAKVPLRSSEGQVIGMFGMSRNITARVMAERQAKALERERDKVEVLSELMSDTSHELRTPLSLINTSLYLLRRSDDPVRRAERMDAIEEQVRYLTALLDQMHNMSALDQSGDFALTEIDIPALAEQLAAAIRPLAEAQHREIRVEIGRHEQPLKANERQLRFAIRNLLENALTFTRDGGRITLRAFTDNDQSVIEVEDDGMGIDPSQLPYIFDRFYKGDQARTIGRGGVGLGLSIVKRIISIHGGDVTVISRPEEGSIFRISLPLHPVDRSIHGGNGAVNPQSFASARHRDA